jgi:hypothetical protein
MRALNELLHASIDYAGLFPPAQLDMTTAVENYARYLASDGAWALGRFIVPAARLPELAEAAQRCWADPAGTPWSIAALAGGNRAEDLDHIRRFNAAHAAQGHVDTLELKASSTAEIQRSMAEIPPPLQVYVEIPIDEDPAKLIQEIGRRGARAKVRTGGVTRDAFPSPAQLACFMARCVASGVPFKATAGLHHPVRAEYRLTYEPSAPTGLMFGFLNLFIAAALLRSGLNLEVAEQVLEESNPSAFQVEENAIGWREHKLSLSDLKQLRQQVLISFGSCSFTEPLDELKALHFLQPWPQQA